MALAAGEGGKALAAFMALEQSEPENGDWARGFADACRILGDNDGEVAALGRAADKYRASGKSLDAVVMLKRILDLDPSRTAAREHLDALFGAPARPPDDRGRPTIDIDADEPLSLANTPGAVDNQGVVEIPVFDGDDLSDAFEAIEKKKKKGPPPFPLSPFFASVSEDAFAELLGELKIFSKDKGATLFRQGEIGHSFFILTKGAVSVWQEGDERLHLADLHEGEIFGEIALLTNQPRSATVVVEDDAELIEVNRASMSRLIYEDDAVMPVLLWFVRERLVDTLVRTSPIFSAVPSDERRALAAEFRFIEAKNDTVLIDQGQSPRGVIVVLAGAASVVRSFDDEQIELGALGPGDVCGEMSLLTHEPALATVRAVPGFIGLELAKEKVEKLIAERPELLAALTKIAEERRVAFVDAIERRVTSDTHLPLV